MVEANPGGFITEVPQGNANDQSIGQMNPSSQVEEVKQSVAIVRPDDISDEEQFSQDEDEKEENQYFQVDDAEPPTNYDDAYSTLPAKIKLQNIKVSCQIAIYDE